MDNTLKKAKKLLAPNIEKSNSRMANSRKNYVTGVIGQFIVLAMGFVCRTVFIKVLGKDYLGINGIFSNIVTLLSLSELGIGTAIIFNLYKPLADNDKDRIYVLMKFYKAAYNFIGIVIFVIGLILMPLLPYIIKDIPSFINVYVIFGLYLLQSASSYFFFAYKSSIIRADQQVYIINTIDWWYTLSLNIAQILSLIIFKNFELYVGLYVVATIIQNILEASYADRLFPFINDKRDDKLSWHEVKEILKDCYALSLWKINTVIVATTNNIFIMSIVGSVYVGYYSNYDLLRKNLNKFLNMFYTAITASVGNLNATDSRRNNEIYKISNFVTVILYSIACLGFYFVGNPFIKVWIGEEYLLSEFIVFLMAVDMYLMGINRFNSTFRSALGLFNYMKYLPLIGSLINILISIWLTLSMGIAGVIIGTIACDFLVYFWFEPLILYKHAFKEKAFGYYILNFTYALVIIVMGLLIRFVCGYFNNNLLLILVGGSLSVILPLVFFPLIFIKSEEFNFIRKNILPKLGEILKRNKKTQEV